MKKSYPNYKLKGTQLIKDNLSPTNKKILGEYIRFIGGTAGEKKTREYEIYMLQFIDLIQKPLNKLTKKDAEAFWSLVNHSDRAIPTKNMIRLAVKRFLKWYYKDLEMVENLHMQKHLVDRSKIKKAYMITPEELEAMIRVASSFRDKAIISLLYESAGRPEEIRVLKWKDISFENKTVNLYSHKTKRVREIPIEKSISWLETWKKDYTFPDIKESDYVFPTIKRTYLSESFFTKLIRKIAEKASIERRITPYWFRRSRLTELYKQKIGDINHRKFAGHTEDSKMTTVYVAMDEEDMQEAIRGLYNVEIPPKKKEEYEKRIKALEDNNQEVKKMLEKWFAAKGIDAKKIVNSS